MWSVEVAPGFAPFRAVARALLAERVHPRDVVFCAPGEPSLFPRFALERRDAGAAAGAGAMGEGVVHVPRALLERMRLAALHADPKRHDVLYRLLWRQLKGDVPKGGLLDDKASPDVAQMDAWVDAVKRDVHHMHAFVRFREVRAADAADDVTWVAFHRPDHFVVEEAAPFFARRYNDMRWSILTPKGSAFFDGTLTFGPPVVTPPREDDGVDELWRTYYASVFNPSRVSPKTMRQHLPTKHHATLPEATAIHGLVREARQRSLAMIDDVVDAGARRFLPEERSIPSLRSAACACTGCELAGMATQTVFGEGPADAALVLVGEQPGDNEDLEGRPFVGPAGRVLDGALRDAGISRERVYLTNTVKHFRHRIEPIPARTPGTYRPDRPKRIHDKPRAGDVRACRPWLEAELVAIRPKVLVCLGSTAARALVHPRFEITKQRGVVGRTAWAPHTIATFHPSAVLRADAGHDDELYAALVEDLCAAIALAS